MKSATGAGQPRIAEINYGYTKVAAPFDGYVSAHLASVGELVGAASPPTQLATIVALDPIYVNFNVNERRLADTGRDRPARHHNSRAPPTPGPGRIADRARLSSWGKLDYIAPTLNQSTGTLAVRGIFPNPNRTMLPGYFVRVRVPIDKKEKALLVPDTALSSDQGGLYLLVVNGDNLVEQRHVRAGQLEDGGLRVIEDGLKPEDRVVTAGLLRAIPGQKVDPQLQKSEQPAHRLGRTTCIISKFFIERPVLSNVIALLMVLIGGVALFKLAVAQYPDVVPPTVQVTSAIPARAPGSWSTP